MSKILSILIFSALLIFGLVYFNSIVLNASCFNECPFVGAKDCFSDTAVKTCGDYDGDGCLEWSYLAEPCPFSFSCGAGNCADNEKAEGQSYCSFGECIYGCNPDPTCCSDECIWGQHKCLDSNYYLVCGNYDDDNCSEWPIFRDKKLCTGDTTCGYSKCLDNERPQWSCVFNVSGGMDLCNYKCVSDSSCVVIHDECFPAGQKRCFDSTSKQICGQYDSDPQLEWSSPESCLGDTSCGYGSCDNSQKPNWYCQNGECSYNCVYDSICQGEPICTNECSLNGQIQCVDDFRKKVCGNYDSDFCLEWSSPRSCIGDTSCGYGSCFSDERPNWFCLVDSCFYTCIKDSTCKGGPSECRDECSQRLSVRCSDDSHKQVCDFFYDTDPCLEWSSPEVCTGDTSCGYGNCSDNQRPRWYCSEGQCVYGCENDSTCLVVTECQNECPERWLTRCVDDKSNQVCGIHYDTDPCLEWYPAELCSGDISCGYKNCNDFERPNWYCNESSGKCDYNCAEDLSCPSDSGYIKQFGKDCHEDDVYWFDSEGAVQEKFEECEDDNPDTSDGCKDGQCYHGSQEEEYCQTQDHCGDGICNCEEDIYICFEDCEFASLKISVFINKESAGSEEWKESDILAPGEKADMLFVVLNESQEEFNNVTVKAELPEEIVYKNKLKIDNAGSKEDIREGINIGFLAAGSEKRITFKTEISKDAPVGAEIEIRGTVGAENISESDYASIVIEKTKGGLGAVFKWIVSKWYIWFILWILFVVFLYWVLRRSSG